MMMYNVNNELRSTILFDGTAEARLADILLVMEQRTFAKREAMEIVGGPGRLRRLCENRKVRFEIRPNGRSYFNASDILRHAIYRRKRNESKRRVTV